MTDEATPGEPLLPPPSAPPASAPPPPPPPPLLNGPAAQSWAPASYGGAPPATTNGFAIAAMVLGIVGFVVCGVGAVLALVFGYKARREIDESGGQQKGRGMAVAGIVLGWVWVGLLVVIVLIAVLVPSDS